jgi:CubicO group peptidase (beta-lactamase class C family)
MKDGFLGPPRARAQNTDMEKTVLAWSHGMQSKQGERFNYNSVDPNLVALAIRGASGQTISKFVYETLWDPIGSEGDASFLTDSRGFENVEAGFNAIGRDWTRLGLLIANRGVINSKQVISEKWFSELATLTPDEKYLDFGRIPQKKEGYKFFFHRASRDATTFRFGGDFGQSIFCDQKTGVVLTILSVSHDGHHYLDLFERAKDLAR